MNKKFLTLILVGSALIMIAGKPVYHGPYQFKVLRYYDADTVYADVDLFPHHGATNMGLRLDGVDTPEMHPRISKYDKQDAARLLAALKRKICEKALAQEARRFTIDWLAAHPDAVLIDATEKKWAGRVVGRIVDGDADLSQALIDAGHGREYHGGKRKGWC